MSVVRIDNVAVVDDDLDAAIIVALAQELR
jgi:hypothetical protein